MVISPQHNTGRDRDPPDSHENTIECAYTRDRDTDRGAVYIGQLYTDRRVVRDANMHPPVMAQIW